MSKNSNRRVLCRQLARDLTPEELDTASGGFGTSPIRDHFTTTFCTAGVPGALSGANGAFQDGDDD